ncbi:MAG TPA: hypothetical protein VEJ42_00210 [Streptosporangiaceae bacterium]|nr:hypothetical protein [Streptosporangiaceae bacterium]
MAARPAGEAPDSAAVYWRRRCAALIVSFSVLGLLSWAAAGVLGVTVRADRPGGRSARSAAMTLGSGSVGSSARLIDPALRGVPDATAAARAAPAGPPALLPPHPALPSCPAAGVGLRLSATAPSYSGGQLAEFAIDVASSVGYSCVADIGAGRLQLQISAGLGRIWTSAECAEGAVTQFATLQPGVPSVVTMTWNEQYSSAGCPMPGQTAPVGRYTATATVGSAVSNSVTFLIG